MNTPEVTTFPELKGNWVMTEPFNYIGNGVDLLIPRGFKTDLASIPRFLWRVIAPFELSLTGPIVHDWLYRTCGLGCYDREDVDRLFRDIMKDEGVSAWRREVAYRGVRIFGGAAWGKDSPEIISLEGL